MKKATKILMITATLIIAVALLVACNEGQQQNDYTVTYVTNGGSAVASQTLSQIATEPKTTRSGYSFVGWYDNPKFDGSRITFPYTLSKDITLYARWIEAGDGPEIPPEPGEGYTVIFDAKGGSAVMSYTGTEIEAEPVTTLSGYEFGGWYDNPACNGSRISFPLTLTKNMTLYAKWDKLSEWVQTSAEDYELYREGDDVVAVIYKGSEKRIILPDDMELFYTDSYLYLGEEPTVVGIKIPDTITEIPDAFWFSSLESVSEYSVNDTHSTMSAKDGVLYSKDGTKLILYPLGATAKSFTVPSTVKTVGEAAFYGNAALESITVSEGVETIDSWGVSYMSNLKNISLPSTLKTLGDYGALESNPLVEELTFPAGLEVFGSQTLKDCTGLKRLVGPAIMNLRNTHAVNLEYLEINGAAGTEKVSFTGRSALKTVVIDAPVNSVCFTDCANLESVTLCEGLLKFEARAFGGCASLSEIDIPSTLTTVGDRAFNNCTSLKRLMLPEGLKSYGSSCFDGSAIEELYIPSTVTAANAKSLNGATRLKTLSCPAEIINSLYSGVTNIEKCPVQNLIINSGKSIASQNTRWESLHTLVIPSSVTSIDNLAFAGIVAIVQITNLSSVDFRPIVYDGASQMPNEDVEIRRSESTPFKGKITQESNGFVKYVYNGDVIVLDCDREIISLSASDFEGYNTIGAFAFVNCEKLASVVIPANIKTVGSNAFRWCESLTRLEIKDGVERIEQYAFSGTSALETVTLPHSLTYVGMNAFTSSGMTINVKGYSSAPSGWHSGWYASVPSINPPIKVNWNA